jgi:hypothetical protein
MSKTATKIEQIDVEDLIPYARNARTHSEQQVTQIAASIRLAKGCADDTIITEAVEAVSTGNARYLGVRIQPRKWSGQQVQTADRPEHTQSEKGIEHV